MAAPTSSASSIRSLDSTEPSTHGTVHWMFDKGLIGLTDNAEIVISRHVNDPSQIRGMINKSGKARLPENPIHCPHPAFLAWHRKHRLKA